MSETDDHPIRNADPKEGFDRAEPQAGAILGFALGSVILLILTIFAIQAYFDKIWKEAVYEKILAPPSEQLKELHNREDWNLTHYGYFDKKSGMVRVPVDKAMQEFAGEAAAGKLFYPAKAYAPKKEEPAAAPPPAPANQNPTQ
ncbi:MAG: hypothetical protein ABSB35_29060 [Bryobacteraceae bacterium]|jgi:hypothetical protein